jgi:hypothetical protein
MFTGALAYEQTYSSLAYVRVKKRGLTFSFVCGAARLFIMHTINIIRSVYVIKSDITQSAEETLTEPKIVSSEITSLSAPIHHHVVIVSTHLINVLVSSNMC